jgi:hypothetical protein
MDNNVPETIVTDNVPETTKIKNPRGSTTFYIDPKIYKRIKLMAVREECTISSLINEALITWVKWLAKAAKDEAKDEAEKEATELEIQIAKEIMRDKGYTMINSARRNRNWALHNVGSWRAMHPGKPWPGYFGNKKKVEKMKDIPKTIYEP